MSQRDPGWTAVTARSLRLRSCSHLHTPATPAGPQQRPARSETVRSPGRQRSCPGAGQGWANGAGVLWVPSVTPEPARRLDALQFGKIKGAYLLQLVCERGLPETVGQVVEPRLVLMLKVEQGAYRILPALRSGSAVLRWSVMLLRLRRLAALTITPLPLCVGQSHGHCAPLRNGAGGAAGSDGSGGPGSSRERRTKLSMR